MKYVRRIVLTAIVTLFAYGLMCFPGLMPTGTAGLQVVYAADRTLPDGDYMIAYSGTTDKTSFYYLDIAGSATSAANNTNVALAGPDKKDSLPAYDIWTLKYSNGYYTITQKTSKMILSTDNTNSGANVKVSQSSYFGSQQWAIVTNGSNGYRIQAKNTNLYLELQNGSVRNGTNAQLGNTQSSGWFPSYNSGGSWLFIPYQPSQPVANGKYILLSGMNRSMELDVVGDTGSIKNGTNIQIYKDTVASRFNSFNLVKLSNGYYRFIHDASGKAMEVTNGSSSYSTNITLNNSTGSIYQQWSITKSGNLYVIRSRCSGYAMEVMGKSTANGTKVVQYPFNGNSLQTNQAWTIVPAEYTINYNANGGSGAPGAQIKYYKAALTLSSAVPYRKGYTFKGWNTKANGTGTGYGQSASYTADASMVLYAQWKSTGKSSKSGKKSFKNKKLKLTSAKSPRKNDLTVKWKKVKGASGYQLVFSKKKSFKKTGPNRLDIPKKKKKETFHNWPAGTWYVKMRGYKKSGGKKTYTKWSTVKKVKVKAN